MRNLIAGCLIALAISGHVTAAQGTPDAAPAPPKSETPQDELGRGSPRGTVQGFLAAARRGDDDIASRYLDTRLTGEPAQTLAQQLFVVLDARLPGRPSELSDSADGSGTPSPGREAVGTIATADATHDIILQRRTRDGLVIWLFSNETLAAIPTIYDDISRERSTSRLPPALVTTRFRGIRIVEWIALVTALTGLYLVTAGLNRVLTPLLGFVWRRALNRSGVIVSSVLPAPARLLLVAVFSGWLLSSLSFSLLMRQLWASIATLLMIGSVAWLLMLFSREVERHLRRVLPAANTAAAMSLLRVMRRVFDVLVIFGALLATLRHFSIDPTPALAGLGVGGIAVALAAQKTLENIIAGASLIFDKAVNVGDFLKMGPTVGTVDHIGLRSTRIRTLDRSMVSVPNSQIATTSVETLSARDMFWFHPMVGLRYETTTDQMRMVVHGITQLLLEQPSVDRASARVRFVQLGQSSLDVEVSAYVDARDWNHFLEVQEQLLFGITAIVERAGTAIAFPSQTMYMAGASPRVTASV